jgi:hypothetical protein
MGKIITQPTGEDNVKRLKIILLSFGIAFSLFFTKIFARSDTLIDTYIVGSIYAFVAMIGLVWAFEFKVRAASFKYILQGGIFVFSEVVFVLLFFFKQFDRIYEGLLLILLLGFLWSITYACFLMINVFNVSLYKKLPLISVAQTASYILTLLMIYFLTFSILASEFPLYVIFPLIFLTYLFLLYMEFTELELEKGRLKRVIILITLINTILLIPFIFVGSNHEVISIVPMIGGFVGGGLLTIKEGDTVKWQKIGYNFILLVIVLISIYISWF